MTYAATRSHMTVIITNHLDTDTQYQLLGALANDPTREANFVAAGGAEVQPAVTHATANGASLRIVLQPDAAAAIQGILISPDGLSLIAQADGEVQVNTSFGSILVPDSLLQQFAAQYTGSGLIVLLADQGTVDQAAAGELRAAWPLVEMFVATRSADGTITPHDPLAMTLTLNPGAPTWLAAAIAAAKCQVF